MQNLYACTRTPLSILLLATSVLACRGDEPVRIGAVLPLSGEYQVYGEASRRGLELARDALGEEAGVELVWVDGGSDPRQAADALRRVYRDGAIAAIGGLVASHAREMAAVAEAAERVLLSPSASVHDENGGARYFFSLSPPGYDAGATLASLVARERGARRAVVIRDPEIAAEGLEDGFRAALEAQGGEVVLSLDVSKRNGDRPSTVRAALDPEPDAVFLTGYGAGVGALVGELRRQGFPGEILAPRSFASGNGKPGRDAAGVLVVRPAFDPGDGDPRVAAFADAYRRQYGEAPDLYAAEAYDALHVLVAALEGRHALPSEVRKGLIHDVGELPGVTGPIRFDERGQASKIPRIYRVTEDGTLQDYHQWRADREEEERRLRARLAEIRERLNDSG